MASKNEHVKKRIMVVEDESIVARDIERTLKSFDYDVVSLESSGDDALMKAESLKPDLVLMDIFLKGEIKGIEAAMQFRSRYQIPVIFLTSFTDDAILEEAKKTEPFGYLTKPFDDRELKSTIEMVLYKAQMERKLKEREEWLSTTLRSIAEGVIATDAAGCITFINPVAEKLMGYAPAELAGHQFEEVFNITCEEKEERTGNLLAHVLGEGRIIEIPVAKLVTASPPREKFIDLNIAPITDSSGSIIGTVIIFRDKTERKRMEEELLKMQKLESIGILAGGIAHEFNNILTAILGNISLAKMSIDETHELYESLNDAEEASFRAKSLAHQLVVFSKGGTPVKKTAQLGDSIREAATFASKGSRLKVDFLIQEDLWPVEVDVDQMSQVISNVIFNSAQAMTAEGGVVYVSAENLVIREKGDYGAPIDKGNYLKITLEDRGQGIPEEHLSRIFDPFFTTKQVGKGLGLAISYSIIKKHNGHIDVQSTVGHGTTVRIFLPVSKEARVSEKKVDDSLQTGRGKILVMEDEEGLQTILKKMLNFLGYQAEVAPDGVEAVRMYKQAKQDMAPFDVVILDLLVSGGMGGKEAIRHLLDFDPGAKCVVSSGYSGEFLMGDYREYGFRECLAKPYNVTQLGQILKNVLISPNECIRE